MRENQFAVAVVLGSCVLIGAVVVSEQVFVQAHKGVKGSIPTGGVLEIGVRQPDLLSGASKVAQEGYKPGVGRYDAARRVMVLLETPKPAIVVRLVEPHVDPSTIMLIQGLVDIQVPFFKSA